MGGTAMIQYAYYPCPFGNLRIGWENEMVISIQCTEEADGMSISSFVSDLAAAQLAEYFDGKRRDFTFPAEPRGTFFQKSVWEALRQIPYGKVSTYKEIATAIGNPNAARAVGMACNRNPIWIAIPCHRVLGSGQALTGYAGGIDMKRSLLQLEQANSPD